MKQKASGLGIEMRTFTRKSGTKYLTFKTPRGSYHTFSEVIARDAAADCGSDHGTTRQRWAKLFKAGSIQGAAVVTGVAICTPAGPPWRDARNPAGGVRGSNQGNRTDKLFVSLTIRS